jgi:hypothetical protein
MYCAHCGSELGGGPGACPRCGRAAQRLSALAAAEIGGHLRASSRDAARAVNSFGIDPVGGLGAAFARLGPERAAGAGIILCTGFALTAALGCTLGIRRWFGFWAELAGVGGAGTFFKSALALLVPPAALIAAILATGKVLRASGHLAGSVFVAGAALAPIGLATFLGGLLGLGNLEVALVLQIAAFTYLVLLLYAGLTSVGGVSSRAAAPAVVAIVVLTGWLTKIAFVALF